MSTTPLKKPITVTFDCIERAVFLAALTYVGADEASAATGIPHERLSRFHNSIPYRGSVRASIENQLAEQGIDWRSWEPRKSIAIGAYPVEFKPGHINVGCKSVTNGVVRDILSRLLNPPNPRAATITTHNDPELTRVVLDLAKRHGHTRGSNPVIAQWIHINCRTAGEVDSNGSQTYYRNQNPLYLDAHSQFGAVLDYFKNQSAQPDDIEIMGEKVEFLPNGIRFAGHKITTEQVKDIVNQLID